MTLATVITAAVTMLAGCGSAPSKTSPAQSSAASASTDPGSKTAAQLVAAAEQPPAWQGPDSPVNVSKSYGKSVWYISFADAIPVLKFWSSHVGALLKSVGKMNFTLFDAQGQASQAQRGFQQAIAAHPAVIITQALNPKLFGPDIRQATAAGIKVITGNTGTPGVRDAGQAAEVTFDYPAVGKLIGDWFVADSGGKGSGLLISSNDVPASPAQTAATLAEVKTLCPACGLKTQDVQIASWQAALPTLTTSTINSDPSLGYLMPLYDGMSLPMMGAIRQANAASKVKVAAFNATPSILPSLADPTSPLAADVGGANEWWAYACADAVFRVLAGDPPVSNYHIGLRMFDRANIASINLKAPEASWYGQATYKNNFLRLWQTH
jgi:ABC-type sugar transport system substrate-binding protein